MYRYVRIVNGAAREHVDSPVLSEVSRHGWLVFCLERDARSHGVLDVRIG